MISPKNKINKTKKSVSIASLVAAGAGRIALSVNGNDREFANKNSVRIKTGRKKANTGRRMESKRCWSMSERGNCRWLGMTRTGEGGRGTSN